jgi:hypothetical protein
VCSSDGSRQNKSADKLFNNYEDFFSVGFCLFASICVKCEEKKSHIGIAIRKFYVSGCRVCVCECAKLEKEKENLRSRADNTMFILY